MPTEEFRCPRCGADRFVSISIDGGYIRRPQCVPCGKIHPGYYGYGSQSPRHDRGWTAVKPREEQP